MLSFLVSSRSGEPSTRFARMGFGKTVLIVAIAALWTAPEGPAEGSDRATDRPNIILIMADDIGYECFGCYGSEQYATPRIDALAREGMRLTHFHAQPLCTPTRVKLMTGLSNVRNYAAFSVLRPGQRTIGDYFKEAGYQTMIGGKWQLLGAEHYAERFRGKGVRPEDVGFQRHCLWQVDRLGKRYWNPLLRIDGTTKQFRAEDYGPRIVTEHLLRFIRSHRDEPFFVYYPMILVHNPFVDPRRNTGRMRGNGQKNFELMVAEMDELVGRITDEVDRLGIADRTLIMFLGDNGTNRRIKSKLGRRIVRGGKGLTTDAGTHVPFIARWTGHIPKGTQCHDLADVSDILPTLLDVAGRPIPSGLDGRSFFPQLQGKKGSPRTWLYCYYNPRPEKTNPKRLAWDHRFKLYATGELYDLKADPLEQHPLTNWRDDPAARTAHDKLSAAIRSFPERGAMLLDGCR